MCKPIFIAALGTLTTVALAIGLPPRELYAQPLLDRIDWTVPKLLDEVLPGALGWDTSPAAGVVAAQFLNDDPAPLLPIERLDPHSSAADSRKLGSRERLIDRTTDPICWLMHFRLRDQLTYYNSDAATDENIFEFRPTIPFLAWDQVHLLRVTMPYDIESSKGPGLGDVTIFDLMVYQEGWGRWGVGPIFRFDPASSSNQDTFQIGPAGGAVSKTKHWTYGFLMENYLSGDVSISKLQPILTYKFDDQWFLGLGSLDIEYDWHDSQWTELPLGFEVGYIADILDQKFQIFVNPQYQFQHSGSGPNWTIYLGIELLVPDA